MEIDRAGRLEDPVQLDQAHRHHHEVGRHVTVADTVAQGTDQPAHLGRHAAFVFRRVRQVLIDAFSLIAPRP